MVLLLFCICADAWGADWRRYADGNFATNYYDTESISRPSRDIVRVWGKRVWTEKGVIALEEKSGEKYRTITHSTFLSEFHCIDKKTRFLSGNNYFKDESVDGSVTYSTNNPSKWEFIIPESVDEVLYIILCE